MPIQFDYLHQPAKVNWGGGCISVFAAEQQIGSPGQIHRGTGGKTQKWERIQSDVTAWRSCAYGLVNKIPTFIIGGGGIADSKIIASTDGGLKWTGVYDNPGAGSGSPGGGVQNIVWDGEDFFAIDERLVNESSIFEWYIIKSSDGITWDIESDYKVLTDDEFTTKQNQVVTDFKDLCPHGIPSGFFGYDKNKDILMIPVSFTVRTDGTFCGNEVTISEGENSSAAMFLDQIRGVSFAAGIWSVITQGLVTSISGAPVTVWVSTDTGKSWDQVYSVDEIYHVNGIASAAKSDIK